MPTSTSRPNRPTAPTAGCGRDWWDEDYVAEVRRLVAEFDVGLAELVAQFRAEEAAAIAAAVDPA